jgi:hypothetical protein
MPNIQKNRFYLGFDCYQHFNQNQSSNSDTTQVNPEQNPYTNNSELEQNIEKNITSLRERQVAIEATCILCKTNTLNSLIEYNNSTLQKILKKLEQIFYRLRIKLLYNAKYVPYIVMFAIILYKLFTGASLLSKLVIYAPMAATVFCMLAEKACLLVMHYLKESGEQINLQNESQAQVGQLTHLMLSFIKDLAKKDKELKDLLSDGVTGQALKNMLDIDNITKKRDTTIKLYEKLLATSDEIAQINDNLQTINTAIDKSIRLPEHKLQKSIYQRNLDKAKQILETEKNEFKIAASELLISLIDNICINFAANKDDQAKIKASFLKSCKNNEDDFKLTLTNIVNTFLKINKNLGTRRIDKERNLFVENAVNNTIDQLYKSVNDTNK